MIAIGSNVLLRYLLNGHARQSPEAKALMINSHPVLLTDVDLAEAIWMLISKRYSIDKTGICTIVRSLIGDGGFVFEYSQVIWALLLGYENRKTIRGKSLDFC